MWRIFGGRGGKGRQNILWTLRHIFRSNTQPQDLRSWLTDWLTDWIKQTGWSIGWCKGLQESRLGDHHHQHSQLNCEPAPRVRPCVYCTGPTPVGVAAGRGRQVEPLPGHGKAHLFGHETKPIAGLCISGRCDRYGDPVFDGYCSVCYGHRGWPIYRFNSILCVIRHNFAFCISQGSVAIMFKVCREILWVYWKFNSNYKIIFKIGLALTITIRLRFDGRSTAYQRSLRSQWRNTVTRTCLFI